MKDLICTTRRLIAQLPEMTSKLKEWKRPDGEMSLEEQQTSDELSAWQKIIEQGVCSSCMWRNYAESTYWMTTIPRGTSEDVAIEWIRIVHLRDECTARGQTFSESELTNVDNYWKK